MRSLAMILLCLVGMIPAQAATLSLTFSGTFPSAFGVIHAGDTFSGTATWNGAASGTLQSASLTMPAGDGLSFASIPNAQVLGTGVSYTAGVFTTIQINVRSTVDSNVYVFFVNATGGAVSNATFTASEMATSYTATGPSVVVPPTPVPPTLLLTILALGCIGLYQARRRFARQV